MIIDISVALQSLRPNAQWHMIGTEYSNIHWDDETQTKPTEEEVNNRIEELKISEPFRLLREIRNKLIASTDWTQLKDIDLDIIRERNWKNYRQALRDLPSTASPKLTEKGQLDMASVTWPDKPST